MKLISCSANDGSHTCANINAIPVHIWAFWKWGITGKYETIKYGCETYFIISLPSSFYGFRFYGQETLLVNRIQLHKSVSQRSSQPQLQSVTNRSCNIVFSTFLSIDPSSYVIVRSRRQRISGILIDAPQL